MNIYAENNDIDVSTHDFATSINDTCDVYTITEPRYQRKLNEATKHMSNDPEKQQKLRSNLKMYKAISIYRDSIARKLDVPPKKFLSEDHICTMMLKKPSSVDDLNQRYKATKNWDVKTCEELLIELNRPIDADYSAGTLTTTSTPDWDVYTVEYDWSGDVIPTNTEDQWEVLPHAHVSSRNRNASAEVNDNWEEPESTPMMPESTSLMPELPESTSMIPEPTPSHIPMILDNEYDTFIDDDNIDIDCNYDTTNNTDTLHTFDNNKRSARVLKKLRLKENRQKKVAKAILLGQPIPKFKKNRGKKAGERSRARADNYRANKLLNPALFRGEAF